MPQGGRRDEHISFQSIEAPKPHGSARNYKKQEFFITFLNIEADLDLFECKLLS